MLTAFYSFLMRNSVQVRKKMNSAVIGLCVASMVVAFAVPLTTAVDSLSLERDPLMMCFVLALCVAFHSGTALIVRGVRRC